MDHDSALGQHELLNVDGQRVVIPEETVERVVTWLSSVAREPTPLDEALFEATSAWAVVGRDSGCRRILERPVRIGSAGLFGIVTEAEGETSPTTVMCLNVSKERHVGPSRLWVDLARQWAERGLRTLRVDLSGLGESGTHAGQGRGVVYPPEASGDIEDAARAMTPEDPSQVVLVGLCSGAHHAIQGGLALAARGVCAVNPVFLSGPVQPVISAGAERARPSLSTSVRRWGHTMAGRRIPKAILGGLPEGAWSLINGLGVRRSPMGTLERLVHSGTDVLVVAGVDEAARIERGESRTLHELERSGRLEFDVLEDLEHSLLGAEDRSRVAALVFSHVSERFGRVAPSMNEPQAI